MAERRRARSKPRTLKHYPLHPEIEERSLEKTPNLALILDLIGEHRRVLDVGCASGYLAKLLAPRGCEVTGIEINPAAAELAREQCARVIVADLDATSLVEAVAGTKFDVIVFGDILEHVHEPRRLLEEAHGVLNADGFIVGSIPNIGHGAVRLSLLHGRFDYQELGILDETHLHFFTRKSVEELFLAAGYRIDRIERTKVALSDDSNLVPKIALSDFTSETLEEIKQDPEHETLQFVLRAYPLTGDSRYRAITKRYLEVNTELAFLRSRAGRQERELLELRSDSAEKGRRLQEALAEASTAREEALHARAAYDAAAADIREAELLRARVTELNAAHENLCADLADRESEIQQVAATAHGFELEAVRLKERLLHHSAQLKTRVRINTKLEARLARAHECLLQHESELAELRTRLTATQHALAAAEQEKGTLQQQARDHESTSERLTAERSALMTQIDELHDAASQAQKQQASVVGRLNEELTNARKAAQQAQTELAAHELQLQETQRALTAKEDERTMLSAQAQLLEEALVEQTAALGEEARAESRQLAALIDDVQRGGSWKLKSVLTRLKSFLRA